MRDIKEVVSHSANWEALQYWGVFGYLVEDCLKNAVSNLQGTGVRIERTYAVDGTALANPVSLQLFSSHVIQFDEDRAIGVRLVDVEPASISFSIGVDGGVLALAWPFDSKAKTLAGGSHSIPFVVGVLTRPQRVSRAWVRRCVRRFLELSLACHPSITPTARTQRVIERAVGRHNRLTGKPAQPSVAEGYEVAAVAVLVSLLAIGVTLAQLAKDYPQATTIGFGVTVLGLLALGWIVVRRLRVFPHWAGGREQ
jgi:hypothetical protein